MRVLLPAVWGAGCILGFGNPGDEYGLYALGSILGVWTIVFVNEIALGPALLAGCAIMFFLAVLLERLGASRKLWLAIWMISGLAIYFASLEMFPSVERAVAKNGSLGAYLALGSQLGAYLATIVTLLVGVARLCLQVRNAPVAVQPASAFGESDA